MTCIPHTHTNKQANKQTGFPFSDKKTPENTQPIEKAHDDAVIVAAVAVNVVIVVIADVADVAVVTAVVTAVIVNSMVVTVCESCEM